MLTRHHKSCKCAQCQAGTSKGKAKGGGSKIAKAQQQSRTKGDGEAPASVSGMPKVCELASGQGDFIVGSEYDKRLEAEENALGAETVGSHLLGKDWRNLVTYEKRVLFSKQLITDSLLGSAVDTMKKPLVRGCKAENGRLVCLPVDAEAEKEDIDMVTSIQEQYDTELALQTEIEDNGTTLRRQWDESLRWLNKSLDASRCQKVGAKLAVHFGSPEVVPGVWLHPEDAAAASDASAGCAGAPAAP